MSPDKVAEDDDFNDMMEELNDYDPNQINSSIGKNGDEDDFD